MSGGDERVRRSNVCAGAGAELLDEIQSGWHPLLSSPTIARRAQISTTSP